MAIGQLYLPDLPCISEIIRVKFASKSIARFKPNLFFCRRICSAFPVRGIPTLIAVDSYGEVITFDGRNDVMMRGASAFSSWHSSVKGTVLQSWQHFF